MNTKVSFDLNVFINIILNRQESRFTYLNKKNNS